MRCYIFSYNEFKATAARSMPKPTPASLPPNYSIPTPQPRPASYMASQAPPPQPPPPIKPKSSGNSLKKK